MMGKTSDKWVTEHTNTTRKTTSGLTDKRHIGRTNGKVINIAKGCGERCVKV